MNQQVVTGKAKAQGTEKLPRSFGWCPDLQERSLRRDRCLEPETPPKRPDPGLYSQQEQFLSGGPVSWNSPDITTNITNGGLLEAIKVVVRNTSADAPALGTQVTVEYSSYGIGLPRTVLGSLPVDLNRMGMAGDEGELHFPLPSALRNEHTNLAVFVSVDHPHDRNTDNNRGEQVYSGAVVPVGGPATFTFAVRNSLGVASQFALSVLEADWSAHLSQTAVDLLPGQTVNVTLTVQVPSDATERKDFNIVALKPDGGLYGGIFHNFDV